MTMMSSEQQTAMYDQPDGSEPEGTILVCVYCMEFWETSEMPANGAPVWTVLPLADVVADFGTDGDGNGFGVTAHSVDPCAACGSAIAGARFQYTVWGWGEVVHRFKPAGVSDRFRDAWVTIDLHQASSLSDGEGGEHAWGSLSFETGTIRGYSGRLPVTADQAHRILLMLSVEAGQ